MMIYTNFIAQDSLFDRHGDFARMVQVHFIAKHIFTCSIGQTDMN